MSLRFYLQNYQCPQCAQGPYLYPGPLGGLKECPNCSHPIDESVVRTRGAEISTDQVVEWWKGLALYCPYCGSRNDPLSENCEQCGGPMKDAHHPDIKTVSSTVRHMLLEVGIDIEVDAIAAAKVDGRGDGDTNVYTASTPLSYVAPVEPEEEGYSEEELTPSGGNWFKGVLIGGGILVVIAAVIFLAVQILTPHKETLRVTGFYSQMGSGYSYPTSVPGECYTDEGSCPSYDMTPVSTQVVEYRNPGSKVISTEEVMIDTGEKIAILQNEGASDEECGTEDLDGVEVVAYCSPTPDYTYETVTPHPEYQDIKATNTSFPRTKLSYTKREIVYEVFLGQVISGRIKSPVFPDIPIGKTAEPSLNTTHYWVTFEVVGKSDTTRTMNVTYDGWYWFKDIGQEFPEASVVLGQVVDLIPDSPDPAH